MSSRVNAGSRDPTRLCCLKYEISKCSQKCLHLIGGGGHAILALDPGWGVLDDAFQCHGFAVHAGEPRQMQSAVVELQSCEAL